MSDPSFDIAVWQTEFKRVIAEMRAGKITSVMLVTATVDGDDMSGQINIAGADESLAYGTELAMQTMIDEGIEPPDYFDGGFDFDEIEFSGQIH